MRRGARAAQKAKSDEKRGAAPAYADRSGGTQARGVAWAQDRLPTMHAGLGAFHIIASCIYQTNNFGSLREMVNSHGGGNDATGAQQMSSRYDQARASGGELVTANQKSGETEFWHRTLLGV